jgi:hypothetical protein
VLPVHYRAQNLSRIRLQLHVGAMLKRYFTYMVEDVEGGIVFPTGQSNVQQWRHDPLQVAGNQGQLRFDQPDAILERDLAVKHANARHIEGHALTLQVKENRVAPGKAVALMLLFLHDSSLFICCAAVNLKPRLKPQKKIATRASPA